MGGEFSLDFHVEGRPKGFDDLGYLAKIVEAYPRKITISFFVPRVKEELKRKNKSLKELIKLCKKGRFVLGLNCFWKHKCPNDGKVMHGNGSGHEVCYWPEFKAFSFQRQKILIKQNARFLKKVFGRYPKIFSPAAHSYNQDTIRAALNARIRKITDRAMIPMYPYKFGRVVVVPEAALDKDYEVLLDRRGKIKEQTSKLIHLDAWRLSNPKIRGKLKDLLQNNKLIFLERVSKPKKVSPWILEYNKARKMARLFEKDRPGYAVKLFSK